jgi:hypothetical protein
MHENRLLHNMTGLVKVGFALSHATWANNNPDLPVPMPTSPRICDERPDRGGAELAALLPRIPKDRLMIETDAPYLVRGYSH